VRGAASPTPGEGRHPRRAPRGGQYMFPDQIEGFYNLVAMVAAYMSLLEHVLVLALPFGPPDAWETGRLTGFIGARWGEKFKSSFDVVADPVAKRHYDALVEISETWRNTYGHGGFDKGHATLHFHTPGVGALPATLVAVRDSPHFRFIPAEFSDYDSICAVFDAIDKWLRSVSAAPAMRWIESGLDVQFDENFRSELAETLATPDGLDNMIGRHSRAWERAVNMEW